MINIEAKKLQVGLSSGKEIIIKRIMLFPEPDLQEIQTLRAKAQEELSGFSTGLGFWGSPSWVIAGATTLGFIESLISNSKAQKGIGFLNEALQKYETLKKKGVLFDIHSINEISQPNPTLWRKIDTDALVIDMNLMINFDRNKTIEKYNILPHQIKDGIATIKSSPDFVHNNEPFVWIEVDNYLTAIRWEFIESYGFI